MIRHLRVQNFKSLRDVVLTLGPRNVLVGPNMSGKSNLLQVFKFLVHLVTPAPGVPGVAHAVNAFGGFTELAWRGGDSSLVSIELEGDLPESADCTGGTGWQYRIDILGSRDRPATPVTVQDERLTLVTPRGATPLIEKEERTGQRIIRDRHGKSLSQISEVQRSALEYEIPDWDGSQLRRLLAVSRFYRLIPELMKRPSSSAAAHFLEEGGGNLAAWLLTIATRYRDAFDKLRRAAASVLPDLLRIYPFPTSQAQVFVASSERFLRSDVPAWQMSDGELCFIALLSLIFAPKDLGAPLYCIEEPENHLHPRLLETLVGLLRQEQEAAGPRTAQVLATTHSPQLVDRIGLDDLVIVDKRDGATLCRRPEDRRELRQALEEAGLGELYFSGALAGA